MDSDRISSKPEESLDALLNGAYAQMKAWSYPMHRLGEYAGDNMVIRGSSTDAFYEFISFSRTPNNYRLANSWEARYKANAQPSSIIKMVEEAIDDVADRKVGESS